MSKLAILWMAVGPLAGADFTGMWLGQKPDVAFKFTQTGSALTGKMYGDYESTPLRGTVAGDLVTFVVNAQEQAGNQINDTRLRFTGKLKDGELELFRERETSTNAGNGGLVQIKNSSKQILHLKRLP